MKYDTYKKWIVDYDRELQTMTWLNCETEVQRGEKFVTKLKCKVCLAYRERLVGRKNFNDKWINEGADSVQTTNFRDHAKSDQHIHAMNLHKKQLATDKGQGPASYAPIVSSLQKIAPEEHLKLQKKFDIAYFLSAEQIAFRKYPKVCELELRHGVNLGTSYLHENAGKEFTHFIAEARRQEIFTTISNVPFFSLLMDSSTDSGNIENEVISIVWCDTDEKIHTCIDFLTVNRPEKADAGGLFRSLKCGLERLGINAVNKEACKKLVGIATDGASANVASGGLRGLVEQELGWIFWMSS